jgi:putative NIF3 family GTP cyclohydrolase 1 type 2
MAPDHGVRARGTRQRRRVTPGWGPTAGAVAVCGGAGDTCLDDAAPNGVDAHVTADLRHHPANAYLAGGGPALIDARRRATEREWLDDVAGTVRARTGLVATVFDLATDPWASHVPSALTAKEPRL